MGSGCGVLEIEWQENRKLAISDVGVYIQSAGPLLSRDGRVPVALPKTSFLLPTTTSGCVSGRAVVGTRKN